MSKFIKKNWLKVTITILTILVSLVIIQLFAKYSISDISAENFKYKLVTKNASILIDNGLDRYLPDNIPISMGYEFVNSDDFRGNGLTIKNTIGDKGNVVEISSNNSKLHYTLLYYRNIISYAFIFKTGLMDENIPNTIYIKKIIDDMIIKDGFTLKRSELKKGHDIIIKETDNSFIIGDFGSYDDSALPQSITIQVYHKTKFFNYFRNM